MQLPDIQLILQEKREAGLKTAAASTIPSLPAVQKQPTPASPKVYECCTVCPKQRNEFQGRTVAVTNKHFVFNLLGLNL